MANLRYHREFYEREWPFRRELWESSPWVHSELLIGYSANRYQETTRVGQGYPMFLLVFTASLFLSILIVGS